MGESSNASEEYSVVRSYPGHSGERYGCADWIGGSSQLGPLLTVGPAATTVGASDSTTPSPRHTSSSQPDPDDHTTPIQTECIDVYTAWFHLRWC